MPITKIFNDINFQAVYIPAEFAYERTEIDYEIERVGDELRIRPAHKSLAGILEKFARLGPDFPVPGRGKESPGKGR